jgi:hypothetical protein
MNLRRLSSRNFKTDEKGDLLADSQNILIRQKNCFGWLLNEHVVNVRQTEMHTNEPLALEPSPFEVEIITEKLREYKPSSTGEIPAEVIQA